MCAQMLCLAGIHGVHVICKLLAREELNDNLTRCEGARWEGEGKTWDKIQLI